MKKALIFLMLLPGLAHAHPGHEAADAYGLAHWLTQADHVAVVLALGLLIWAAALPLALKQISRQRDQAQRRAWDEQ